MTERDGRAMGTTRSFCDDNAGTLAVVTAAALAVASLFFHIESWIDLAVARHFFDPASAVGPFPANADPVLRILREVGLKLPPLAMILLGVVALAGLFRPGARMPVSVRDALWMLTTAGLANGLLVNLVLKEHWGRARPHQTLEFGGAGTFTPAWTMSDACASNCSFVSGEAANAFWMLTALCLVPAGYRAPAGAFLVVLAGTVAFNRVAFGGHYLSDVVLSGLMVLTIAAVLRFFFRPGGPRGANGNGFWRRLRAGYSAAAGD